MKAIFTLVLALGFAAPAFAANVDCSRLSESQVRVAIDSMPTAQLDQLATMCRKQTAQLRAVAKDRKTQQAIVQANAASRVSSAFTFGLIIRGLREAMAQPK